MHSNILRAHHTPAFFQAVRLRHRRAGAVVAASTTGCSRSRPTDRSCRGRRTSRPRRRTSSICSWPGAPSQLDLFDNKPALQKHDGQQIPAEFIPKGERFAFIKGTPRLLGSPFKFKQPRPVRRGAVRAAAASGDDRRRHRHHPLDAHDAIQSRARPDLHEHRQPGVRPAQYGLVADVRARQREPRPARIRGPALGRERTRRRQVVLGERISADGLPGRRVPVEGRSRALRLEPGGRRHRRAPRARSISSAI